MFCIAISRSRFNNRKSSRARAALIELWVDENVERRPNPNQASPSAWESDDDCDGESLDWIWLIDCVSIQDIVSAIVVLEEFGVAMVDGGEG